MFDKPTFFTGFSPFPEAGLFDVTCKLYPGGRHEMLNETCRAEVQEDLYRWLIRRV